MRNKKGSGPMYFNLKADELEMQEIEDQPEEPVESAEPTLEMAPLLKAEAVFL